MNYFVRLAALGSISIALFSAGCATEGPTAPSAQPKSVPDISVLIDCGNCQVRSTVPELIHKSYAAAAAKAGIQIKSDTQMKLTIKDYTERSLVARSVSFVVSLAVPPAAFLLKDQIKADALIDEKQLRLEEHYRIPFLGIETVAEKLGEQSFSAVIKSERDLLVSRAAASSPL